MRTQSDAQALLYAEKSARQELRGVLHQTELDAAQRLNEQQREAHQQQLNQANEVSMVLFLWIQVQYLKVLRLEMDVLTLILAMNNFKFTVNIQLKFFATLHCSSVND